jgi:nucleotide-binding universal stress UspA family protein
MLPFRTILFPVDYSESCIAIIPSVVEMLQHFSAELTVVHAYGPEALAYSPLPITDPRLPEEAEAIAEERLQEFVKTHFPGRRVELFTGVGEPGGVIHDVVKSEGADLVMLPTHGRGPLRRLLLGSVTAKVLHDLTVPVWTGSHLAGPLPIGYKSILAAVDTSDEAEVVVRAAAAFAESYQAKLSLTHVLEMPPVSVETAYGPYLADFLAGADTRMNALKAKAGVTAPHNVVNGAVAYAIGDEAKRVAADLIVTGRGEVFGALSRMWSHLYPIVRHAPCPVLSI